ncbi:MAG: hypothetical protein HUJ29_00770 [Gammaproteobacteria bacterium]|nr:hypothetical protein [Gammaproteobacteria bacterium]
MAKDISTLKYPSTIFTLLDITFSMDVKNMAKLDTGEITKDDIKSYLENYSDFSFELKILAQLTALGLDCTHGGTYEDPITKKTREYDIRGLKSIDLNDDLKFNLYLSVECKNIRPNFPLVLHRTPRTKSEAYLDLIHSDTGRYPGGTFTIDPKYGTRVRLRNSDSPYKANEFVSKSCDQVGKKKSGTYHEVIGTDSDVFEKISQAINSAYDLIATAHYCAERIHNEYDCISIVLPILVVPENRLWTIDYNQSGDILKDPIQNSRASYYIGKAWTIGDFEKGSSSTYGLSHLEVVTPSELDNLISDYLSLQATSSSEEVERYITWHSE